MASSARPLAGKTALVTGAASGIGREVALALAGEGCNLVLADRAPEALAAASQDMEAAGAPRVLAQATDVTDEAAVKALAKAIEAGFGRLDILVNNAGVGSSGEIMDSDPAQVRRMIDVNFWGLYLVTRYALPLIVKAGGGDVVDMASVAGLKYAPGYAIYSATKFAAKAFGEALRNEVQGRNIRVMTVYPGMTDTAFFQNGFTADGKPPASTKTGGILPPASIAAGIIFGLKLPPETALNDFTIRPTRQAR